MTQIDTSKRSKELPHKEMKWLEFSTFLLLFFGLGSCALTSNERIMFENNRYPAPIDVNASDLVETLGLGEQWQTMDSTSHKLIEEWRPLTSKIIFERNDSSKDNAYLVECKRSRGGKKSRKDRLWEFPGGHVDQEESAIAALIRELDEEDPSGVLFSRFKQVLDEAKGELSFLNIALKNGEHHTLFKTDLQEESWEELKSYWHSSSKARIEVYEFLWVEIEQVDTRHPSLSELWTPKSRKILESMRKI